MRRITSRSRSAPQDLQVVLHRIDQERVKSLHDQGHRTEPHALRLVMLALERAGAIAPRDHPHPLQTVPVVAVIGRNGYLVDYQVGYSASHGPRLAAAVELAVRMPADAPPFLDSPDAEPPDL